MEPNIHRAIARNSVLTAMKISQAIILSLLLKSALTMADVNINKAMSAYKEQKYDQAAHILLNNALELKQSPTVTKLKAALVFSKNLKLYQEIYVKSKSNQRIYLTTLVNIKQNTSSQYAKLFLAEIFILDNELQKADELLNEFRSSISNTSIYYQIANIYRAWIAYLNHDQGKYDRIIQHIDRSIPLLDLGVHFIEVLLTGKTNNASNTIVSSKKNYIQEGKFLSSRYANYVIRHYVNQQKIIEASQVLLQLDQSRPSFVEKISETKVVRFYEVTLIDTVAELYYELSKSLLQDVSEDKKYHDIAIFYLSELDLVRLHKNSAREYLKAINELRRLPKKIHALKEIRAVSHGYLMGDTSRALQTWQKTVDNFENDPYKSADAVLMCLYLKVNCPKIVQRALLSAEMGRSKRFESLSTNVGRYFLSKQRHAKALRLLESAMDRSNTNSMLANEAILLLNYAEALRLNKNFSVSLQIYFSLGENFPIIRQIQDAVQGEYLFRQRSNGASNVF